MGALSAFSVIAIITTLSILFKLAEKIEEENRMMERGLATLRIYNEALHQRIEEIRRFRHDAVGILQAIEAYGLDDNGELPASEAKSNSAGQSSKNAMPLLEAIVELKRRQCVENSIAFEEPGDKSFFSLPQALLPDETDLCLLVQNLLDNAYEANLRIEDKNRRFMSLAVICDKPGTIMLKVVNRIDDSEKMTFLTRKSRPELHGIGLRIVDDTLRKYHGKRIVSTDETDHTITTEVNLRLQ